MKWTSPTVFQMSTTTIVKSGGERERIQGTMNTVFYYECVFLDKVWEKGKKNPKRFIVILAKQFWKNSRCMLALSKWVNVLGSQVSHWGRRDLQVNMEREKLRRLIGIGCFGMNAFLKYVHAEAFSCNMYACMCLYVYLYVHGRIA